MPIVALLIASFLSDQFALWLARTYQNSMPASHLYGFLHAVILFWFFCQVIPESKKLVIVIGASYLVLYVLNSAFNETIFTYNSLAKVVQNLTFISVAFWYFFDVYRSEDIPSLEKSGIFWAVVAIFIYHSGALFTHLLSSKILNTGGFFGSWVIHNLFNITKNLLFGMALWISRIR